MWFYLNFGYVAKMLLLHVVVTCKIAVCFQQAPGKKNTVINFGNHFNVTWYFEAKNLEHLLLRNALLIP